LPRAGNLLQLACTVLGAESAAVALEHSDTSHSVAHSLALLGVGSHARAGVAQSLGACRAAAKPSSVIAVDNPGRDGRLAQPAAASKSVGLH